VARVPGTISALDRFDSFERTTVLGAMTVPMTEPGTTVVYYEGPAELARYADPTATGRPAIPYNPATDATTEVRYVATAPTWQQLRLTVTGPDGAVPVSTYRSTARYDVTPGQLGRAVARFEATTPGLYRVSAARATEAGATLAVGDNFARTSP
jgi:methionine synthase II (cobalamin-independent)